MVSVLWRVFITLGLHQYMWGITSVQCGVNISTVEGIQYSGERILISARLVINNDEKNRHFLYYDTKFSFGSFLKIQADFMPFET